MNTIHLCVRLIRHGDMWFAERASDGTYFIMPASPHSVTPRWTHNLAEAANWTTESNARFTVNACGYAVLPRLPSTRTHDWREKEYERDTP